MPAQKVRTTELVLLRAVLGCCKTRRFYLFLKLNDAFAWTTIIVALMVSASCP